MQIGKDTPAIVTGGASGLGAAAARRLADAGAKVTIFDIDEEKGRALASEIGGAFCHVDVTSDESVEAGFAYARAMFGAARIAVSCAGIAIGQKTAWKDRDSGEIKHHDLAKFARVIDVNLSGTFRVSALAAADMLSLDPVTEDGGRGVIVCTASVAAVEGQIGQVAYAASKGGVLGMTLPMARDLARAGVRCMSIMPGLFRTPILEVLPDEALAALAATVPFPARLGEPEEYAALVQHIVENDMLNGSAIRLDGALRMAPR